MITFQPDLLPVGGAITMSVTRLRGGKIILSLMILKTAQEGCHRDWAQAAAGP